MQDFQKASDRYLATIEKGKSILQETRNKIYKIPAEYKYLISYVGENKTLREDLLSIIKYLLNPQNKKNEAGETEQRFFTSNHRYCFFLDTNAIVEKIFHYKRGRGRANQGINLLCALGFFTKDKQPWLFNINQNMKLNSEQFRYMTIYHFKSVDLKELEARAEKLRHGKIGVSNISRASLKAAGLSDIAEEVYFQNDVDMMPQKIAGYRLIVESLDKLLDRKGYCTRSDLIEAADFERSEKKILEILRMFKINLERDYCYRPARQQDRTKYNYNGRKWIYTRKDGE